jgi:predicted house-cleaning noncanonical NTP pyrophosphatase (MazG superfamily)
VPKIIRDGLAARIPAAALRSETDDGAVLAMLETKMAEEIGEFAASGHADARELGDALEVLRAIAARAGVPWVDVEAARFVKRSRLGGFDGGLVYDETLDPKGGRP